MVGSWLVGQLLLLFSFCRQFVGLWINSWYHITPFPSLPFHFASISLFWLWFVNFICLFAIFFFSSFQLIDASDFCCCIISFAWWVEFVCGGFRLSSEFCSKFVEFIEVFGNLDRESVCRWLRGLKISIFVFIDFCLDMSNTLYACELKEKTKE